MRVLLTLLFLVCGLPSVAVAASQWLDMFTPHGASLPPPSEACQVCFYEKPKYFGDRFCVGPREAGCDSVLSIAAPPSIGSVKFTNTTACDLVANIRVLDPPFGRHIDSITADVEDTHYNFVVQEIFVEKAGRACFLAAVNIDEYGKCYDASVPQVEDKYRDAFYEAVLFKNNDHDFNVTVYELDDFKGLSKELNTSTDDLSLPSTDASVMPPSLQMKIRSIAFISNA